MSEQLAFPILEEALDQHRERVQAWFDALPDPDKMRLAELLRLFEYDTCVALSAAAGDYRCSYLKGNGHAHQTCTPAEVL